MVFVNTSTEDHREWGKTTNGRCWELLGTADRTPDQDRELIDCAHASLWHWRYGGTAINEQRGEWMIAHAYARLGRPLESLEHAQRCLDITMAEQLEGFDLGYAYEAMARALALRDDPAAADWRAKATAVGETITDDEDRSIFLGDLNS